MTERRPLPLVTDNGPMCRRECPQYLSPESQSGCGVVGPPLVGMPCIPDLVETYLREQARKLEVCGRCEHYRRRIGGEMDCYFNSTLNPWSASESCSRFAERTTSTSKENEGHGQ